MALPDVTTLIDGIRSGNRRSLARSITLLESTRSDHRTQANQLLDQLTARRPDAEPEQRSIRLGISGTPGVGKSTFIEALGMDLIRRGLRVAVLAVDPSSVRTGGAILGDKTRMMTLSREDNAFIRPTASSGILGGVAGRTGDVVRLVEAAGFDVVLVETVGVGQSEVAVASITDLFLLLVAPAGGDDLQGIKRGVMELVDAIVVNKADGDLEALAAHTAADYRHALSYLRPVNVGMESPVLTCSALHQSGVTDVWDTVVGVWTELNNRGSIESKRADQCVAALDAELRSILLQRFIGDQSHMRQHQQVEEQVRAGLLSPSSGAALLTDETPRAEQ